MTSTLQLFMLFAGIVTTASTALLAWLWNERAKRALNAEEPHDRCIACDSIEVRAIGARAYRCTSCDHEGGPGLMALKKARRLESMKKLTPEERDRQALSELKNARISLASAHATLSAALQSSLYDLAGASADDGRSKQHELSNAINALIEGEAHLRRADELNGRPDRSTEDTSSALSPALSFADFHLDSLAVDWMVHSKISALEGRASEMLRVVDAAIARQPKS